MFAPDLIPMALRIEMAPKAPAEPWQAGTAVRLILAAYAGNQNTGADVRVAEIVRQMKHIFVDDQVRTTVLIKGDHPRGYFQGADLCVLEGSDQAREAQLEGV